MMCRDLAGDVKPIIIVLTHGPEGGCSHPCLANLEQIGSVGSNKLDCLSII